MYQRILFIHNNLHLFFTSVTRLINGFQINFILSTLRQILFRKILCSVLFPTFYSFLYPIPIGIIPDNRTTHRYYSLIINCFTCKHFIIGCYTIIFCSPPNRLPLPQFQTVYQQRLLHSLSLFLHTHTLYFAQPYYLLNKLPV